MIISKESSVLPCKKRGQILSNFLIKQIKRLTRDHANKATKKDGQTDIPKTMRDHDWHDQRWLMQDLVGFKSCNHAWHERISSRRGGSESTA